MITIRANFLAIALALLLGRVYAQTSLYIPGFDPQPISVNQLGVGSDGRTTWELQPGVTSGSFDDIGFAGTATLVEGPSDAHLIWTYPAGGLGIDESCVINGGIAVCTVAAASGNTVVTDIETESAVPFEVQGGSAVGSASGGSSPAVSTPAPSSPSVSPSGSSVVQAPSRSSGSPVASQTSGGNPSPSGTGSSNGAVAVVRMPSLSFVGGVVLGGFALVGL